MKRYRVTVDGVEHQIDVEESSPGVYSVKIDEKQVTVSIEENSGQASQAGALQKTRAPGVTASGRSATTACTAGDVQVTSPMPGNVLSIIASQGAQVKYGDPVIILEAMKMKNEIPAPVNGIIREIRVKEGDTVDSEDIIAIIQEVNDDP
jgi:biotin carboxyl carrier protein